MEFQPQKLVQLSTRLLTKPVSGGLSHRWNQNHVDRLVLSGLELLEINELVLSWTYHVGNCLRVHRLRLERLLAYLKSGFVIWA